MNLKMIKYIIGKMLGVEAVVLLVPAFIALLYTEDDYIYFLITSVGLGLLYLIFGRKKPDDRVMYAKEGLIIVAAAWVLWSVFGAMPYYLSGTIPNYVDAFFEAVSGFTTTGATILTDIESVSMGMMFWRSFTQWIGGMGVLVLVMVLTSLENKSSMHLMRAELSGPQVDKLQPKARKMTKWLYGIYVGLTLLQIIFLLAGGMDLFDSVIHAFTTTGTGGFSNRVNSVAAFDSAYIEGVITVFSIISGISFKVYYLLCIRAAKEVFLHEEVKLYLAIIVGATAAITVNIWQVYGSGARAFRNAIFQVATMTSTAGFTTADYNRWPMFSQSILLVLMMIGACAGSTGGGLKISRLLILVKSIKRQMHQLIHPKSVSIVKVNGKKVNEETMHGVYMFLGAYLLILMGSVILLSLDNYDFATTFTAALATINNIGPGIGRVGPWEHFYDFSNMSKIVMCFNMFIGRLEIFPFLLLLSPSLWRKRF